MQITFPGPDGQPIPVTDTRIPNRPGKSSSALSSQRRPASTIISTMIANDRRPASTIISTMRV